MTRSVKSGVTLPVDRTFVIYLLPRVTGRARHKVVNLRCAEFRRLDGRQETIHVPKDLIGVALKCRSGCVPDLAREWRAYRRVGSPLDTSRESPRPKLRNPPTIRKIARCPLGNLRSVSADYGLGMVSDKSWQWAVSNVLLSVAMRTVAKSRVPSSKSNGTTYYPELLSKRPHPLQNLDQLAAIARFAAARKSAANSSPSNIGISCSPERRHP